MKRIVTSVFRFRTDKERAEATERLRAAKELKANEQANATVTIETTMRSYTMKRSKDRIIAIKPKNRDELHMNVKDIAALMRELDYVVRDKKEPLY